MEAAMEISEDVRAAHRDLSPAASRLLDYVLAHPQMACRVDFKHAASVPEWLRRSFAFEIQSWPILLGAEKLREIARATRGMMRLLRCIPERVFGNDVRRINAYYGWDNELATQLMLAPPNGFAGALARCEFIAGTDGLKCAEVNASANIGGWQMHFWERVCRENPALAPFLGAEGGLRPVQRNSCHALFSHLVSEARSTGIADGGEINVALVTHRLEARDEGMRRDLNALYAEALERAGPGLGGEVLGCVDYDGLISRGGRLSLGGQRVHAVLEYGGGQTPPHVYRCFKARTVGLYNGPAGVLLSDKRNLALLSRLEESDDLSAEERALVRDHVPWSREVADGSTTFHGEKVSLLDFARAHRDSLVLKPADGSRGVEVYLGSQTAPEEWSAVLQKAAASRRYLLQEYVPSRPYLFQHGPAGCAVHDLVWGTFCFGDAYGGGFVRLMPRGHGPQVINSARGACEAIMFEV